MSTRTAYLDLLKNCLLDNIYGSQLHTDKNGVSTGNLATAKEIEQGIYWPNRAHTMIGRVRLENILHCAKKCLLTNIEGDFMEAGVWRGGATIFMKGILNAFHSDRRVFVADSFCGLPKPSDSYPVDADDKHHTFKIISVSKAEVERNFRSYNLLDDKVVFIEGFFETSLKNAPIDKLAILRIDADMYSSTMQVLTTLYDKVSAGGYIIIDDYTLKGALAAVNDFRSERKIKKPIVLIGDGYSAYWRK